MKKDPISSLDESFKISPISLFSKYTIFVFFSTKNDFKKIQIPLENYSTEKSYKSVDI